MGDRANVYMVQQHTAGPSGLYLYTHWDGERLPFIVQKTLQRQQRWEDDSYLARMIFCEMVGPASLTQETGYGIAVYPPDNEHAIVVVNCISKTVGFAQAGKEPKCYVSWSFEAYIALDEDTIRQKYGPDPDPYVRRD